MIDWEGKLSHVLINPSYSAARRETVKALIEEWGSPWEGHLWFATSGSSNQKWVGISKTAFLNSAKAVNQHVESTSSDCWLQALPRFHAGGLAIEARAYLTGAVVIPFSDHASRWDPVGFCEAVRFSGSTLSSLVPAQLYDLMRAGCAPPSSLRALIIGGGALPASLYTEACRAGWPVLPSYGLTECSSQVATAALGSWASGLPPVLQKLPHLQVCLKNRRFAFKGPSLFSVYLIEKQQAHPLIVDGKEDGWFVSEDVGEILGEQILPKGRVDSLLKIGGESVDFFQLELRLQELRAALGIEADLALVSVPDLRLGEVIGLAHTGCPCSVREHLIELFNQHVLPFERIRVVQELARIPRSPLQKLIRNELREAFTKQSY